MKKTKKQVEKAIDKLLEPRELDMVSADKYTSDYSKMIVVVSETVNEYESTIKLDCGRAAAQACHAVSKLKLSYVEQLVDKGYDPIRAIQLVKEPITTIVLKARDTNELHHIMDMTSSRNLHMVDFYDDNVLLYKGTHKVLTAIAIGPVESWWMDGLTDYLPLWKCGCEPVVK
jgi:peptidyl-tRNA hydrolase